MSWRSAGEGPSLSFVEAMEQEHTQRPDSLLPFTTTNYGLTTWPAQARPLPESAPALRFQPHQLFPRPRISTTAICPFLPAKDVQTTTPKGTYERGCGAGRGAGGLRVYTTTMSAAWRLRHDLGSH